MRLFLFVCFILLAFTSSSMADEEWKKGMRAKGDDTVRLLNGREYMLSSSLLFEYPDKKELDFRNAFDFENGLIYHETAKGERITVTPLTQIPGARVSEVKEIACYLAKRGGSGMGADPEARRFFNKSCPQ